MRRKIAKSKSYLDSAAEILDESIYHRLKCRAKAILQRETSDHRLEPTDLVHEAYLRMARGETAGNIRDSTHMLALATIVMRRILIDYHRSPDSPRKFPKVPLDDELALSMDPTADAVPLHQVLERLYLIDAQLYRVVQMRFFWGLDLEEIASVLLVSSRTVKRDWSLARAWLRRELSNPTSPAC